MAVINMSQEKDIKLIFPTYEYADDIWAFRQEVIEEDDGDDNQFAGCFGLGESQAAEEWIDSCMERKNDDWGREHKMVPSHSFLAIRESDNKIVGIIDLRHHINHPVLGTWGGQVGYTVRPSERKKGYAKEILRQNLIKAREMGLDKLLITCDESNVASEKTIVANGGVFESLIDSGDGELKKRYWITLD